MTASFKLRKLESKISALRWQQDQLLQQQANHIAKIILRLELAHGEISTISGCLLMLRDKMRANAPELEGWRLAGEKFLRVGKAKKASREQPSSHSSSTDQSSF